MDLAKENKSKDFLAVMKTREKELIENMGKAIENNQKDIFDKILTEEIDFNILTKNSESLILKAVKSNNLYYINKLIEKKAELKGKKLIFNTNNKEIISILVKEKVDLEEKDKNGETVLVSAVKARETEKVKMLVELGAKTDVVDTKKNNLIDLAIMSNNSPLVTYFLEKGIKVNTKNKDLLVWGVQENNIKLVEVFGNNFGYLDYKDKQGRNLLMIAAINNSKNVAEYLVNRGLSLVEKDKSGLNAIMYAAKHNSVDVAKLLIKKGSEPRDALEVAIIWDSMETLKLFDKNGIRIKEKDKFDRSLLMLAAEYNAKRIAEYLLDEGLDEDDEDKNGETALMYAARNGAIEVADVLIKKGANKKTKNKKDEKLLGVSKNNEMREFLLSKGVKW